MADYNYELAQKTIQQYSDLLESAFLGMAEDWWWTSMEVYENGCFTVELEKKPKIAGISGSRWATPTLLLKFKDGTESWLDCYEGDLDYTKKPEWFALGELSSPAQEIVDMSRGKYIS